MFKGLVKKLVATVVVAASDGGVGRVRQRHGQAAPAVEVDMFSVEVRPAGSEPDACCFPPELLCKAFGQR